VEVEQSQGCQMLFLPTGWQSAGENWFQMQEDMEENTGLVLKIPNK